MSRDLLLGIDLGTGGCKVTLIDPSGAVVESASGEYPTIHPRPAWAEQDPACWYAAMCGVLQRLRHRDRISALALDSYTHGAVLLDGRLEVIRPTILWTDQRSVGECADLRARHLDMIFRVAYQAPTPTWTLPQMLWLSRNEPDSFARLRHMLFVKDHVRHLLTGEMACDSIEAQGTLFWDMEAGCWSEPLCALAGIPPSVLPPIRRPTDLAGRITRAAARDTGLAEGLPVVMGASDSAVEAYAAGAVAPGQCVLKLATAGNVNVMTGEPHPDPETLTYSHVVPGLWYTVTATNSAASCQRWFRDTLCPAGTSYEELNECAARSLPGSNGVLFHPYLQGERSPYWDADLRGSFTGMSMATSRADLCRALLEGVAYSLRDCHGTIGRLGLAADEFRLIGGGARNPLWASIVCDVFDSPILLPSCPDASFGSAMLAGVGTGVFEGERAAAERCVRLAGELRPDPDRARRYALEFARYRRMHDALADCYRGAWTADPTPSTGGGEG